MRALCFKPPWQSMSGLLREGSGLIASVHAPAAKKAGESDPVSPLVMDVDPDTHLGATLQA
jgi:hypothetical protein